MKLFLGFSLASLAVASALYDSQCVMDNIACALDNNVLGSYNDTNRVGCQERCRMMSGCQNWTWWGDTTRCQVFSHCQDSNQDCSDCLTGTRSCGNVEKHVSIVSGGKDRTSQIQTQNSVTVVSDVRVCENPEILSDLSQMPRHRWGHVSAFIDSVYLVCGGSTDQYGGLEPNNTCDMFNVASHQWEQMEDMSLCRHQGAGIGMLGKFYVTGGITEDGNNVDSMEVYDPASKKWSPGPSMPAPLSGHCVVQYQDSFIVIGGTVIEDSVKGEPVESSLVLSFNVTLNTWTLLGNLITPRTAHGCSINERNEIIVTGGISSTSTLKSSEKIIFTSTEASAIVTEAFTDLPVKISHHGQSDTAQVQVLGGQVSNVGRNFVIEYENVDWEMTNVTLPQSLSYHHVTRYPASYVHCS